MKKISDNIYLIEGNLYSKSDVIVFPDSPDKITLHVKGDVLAYTNIPINLNSEDEWLDLDKNDIKFYDIIAFSSLEVNT
jgi:hypothetical protein